ncbi:MAG: SIS domain-containing protein [Anaerolineae bacterium]
MHHSVNEYMSTQLDIIARTPLDRIPEILALFQEVRKERRHVYVFGNGGSGSTASHFACDLGKGTVRADKPRFKVTALQDNLAMFSAYSNDMGYDKVFVEPLITLAEPGDIAIAFSGSGNSPNVLRAIEEANQRHLHTIGFSGFQGGALKDLAQFSVVVPCDQMDQIEDVHLMLAHAICRAFKLEHE